MKRKFNIIDLLIVIAILAVLGGGYWYMNRDQDATAIETGEQKITFVAEATKIYPDTVDKLQVGDKCVAEGQFQDGVITDVVIEDDATFAAKDGEIIKVTDTTMKRVVVTVEATVNRYGPYMDLGGQEIKAGKTYWIQTDQFKAYGSVLTVLVQE